MQPTVQHRNTLTRAAFNGKTPHDTLYLTHSSDFKLILTLPPPYQRHGFFHFCVPMLRNSVIPAVFIKHITITSFKLVILCFSGQFFKYHNYFTSQFDSTYKVSLGDYLNCFLQDALSLMIFSFRCSLYVWMSPGHLVTVPFSHTQISSATCKTWTAYCKCTIHTWIYSPSFKIFNFK